MCQTTCVINVGLICYRLLNLLVSHCCPCRLIKNEKDDTAKFEMLMHLFLKKMEESIGRLDSHDRAMHFGVSVNFYSLKTPTASLRFKLRTIVATCDLVAKS